MIKKILLVIIAMSLVYFFFKDNIKKLYERLNFGRSKLIADYNEQVRLTNQAQFEVLKTLYPDEYELVNKIKAYNYSINYLQDYFKKKYLKQLVSLIEKHKTFYNYPEDFRPFVISGVEENMNGILFYYRNENYKKFDGHNE